MSHQAVTIGFEPTSQPLEHRLIAWIAVGQRGACHKQRQTGVHIGYGGSDGLRAGE
jgi:hypothetical protein